MAGSVVQTVKTIRPLPLEQFIVVISEKWLVHLTQIVSGFS
jgi:hypothetical protein